MPSVDKASFEGQSDVMHVLALALASALAVEVSGPETSAREQHPAPWYLPRTASVGFFFNPPSVSVNVRLAWEIGVIEQPRNHLVMLLQAGTATALSLPFGIKELYQHVGLVGFGFRSTRELFHWGFTIMTGPLWYRASYLPSFPYNFESRVVTYSEATAQAGLHVAKHLVVGLYAGYAAPWDVSTRFPASAYTGGFTAGLFADWR